MPDINRHQCSPFHLCIVATVLASLTLYFVSYVLIIIPIGLFIALCLITPYFQRLSFFLPIITEGNRTQNKVALTFDDGPDPHTTSKLLDLLSKYGFTVTFYVIGQKVQKHPELIMEILKRGHAIGNHSHTHDSILMLRRTRTMRADIENCQKALQSLGVRPLTFRPPVGITNPKLGKVLNELDMLCLGFSCRAVDFGNRFVARLAEKILGKIRNGDIVMLHDRQPAVNIPVETWLTEIEAILNGIRSKKLEVVPLSELIEHPVMVTHQ